MLPLSDFAMGPDYLRCAIPALWRRQDFSIRLRARCIVSVFLCQYGSSARRTREVSIILTGSLPNTGEA